MNPYLGLTFAHHCFLPIDFYISLSVFQLNRGYGICTYSMKLIGYNTGRSCIDSQPKNMHKPKGGQLNKEPESYLGLALE